MIDSYPRHPSMLYEALLEGVILFIILFIINQKKVFSGIISGYFLLFYGIFRFFVEFVRLPDAHIGYIYYDWVTMGQLLTIPMLVIGLILIYRKPA
jgi:phosphatidylglycerol:prolipoprotein diacylglycerol transferase